MFDVSFSELLLIGIIALVVIGPERLPKVARTLGHLVGRAQRYVNDVKSDIKREIDLDEIKNLKSQFEDAASSVKSSMTEVSEELREPLEDAQKALKDASGSMETLIEKAKADIESQTSITADQPVKTDEPVAAVPDSDPNTLPLPGFDSITDTNSTTTRTGSPT